MRIVLHPAFVSTRYIPGSNRYLLELLIEMAFRHPSDSFIILTNGAGKSLPELPANMKVELVKTGVWAALGWSIWNRFRLPTIIKKLHGDLLISNDVKTRYAKAGPACFIELNGNKNRQQLAEKKTSLYNNRALQNLKGVRGIITFSAQNKEALDMLLPGSRHQIHVLDPGPIEDVQPLKWVEKENIKIQFTGGKEYFVYAGDLDEANNLHTLLKAFSRFKKRQLSNMQLVLAGSSSSSTTAFSEKLGSFKYRADVHLLPDPAKQVLLNIIAAAYAFVSPAPTDDFPLNTLRAVSAEVPVIAFSPGEHKRDADGIIYAPENTDQGFADTMQLIYKDEDLRAAIIREGRNQVVSGETYDMVEAFRQLLMEILQTNHSNFTII